MYSNQPLTGKLLRLFFLFTLVLGRRVNLSCHQVAASNHVKLRKRTNNTEKKCTVVDLNKLHDYVTLKVLSFRL